jgi:hypothetical protein
VHHLQIVLLEYQAEEVPQVVVLVSLYEAEMQVVLVYLPLRRVELRRLELQPFVILNVPFFRADTRHSLHAFRVAIVPFLPVHYWGLVLLLHRQLHQLQLVQQQLHVV